MNRTHRNVVHYINHLERIPRVLTVPESAFFYVMRG
jgi:hypothetical protein